MLIYMEAPLKLIELFNYSLLQEELGSAEAIAIIMKDLRS
jgi:hypothetical protein